MKKWTTILILFGIMSVLCACGANTNQTEAPTVGSTKEEAVSEAKKESTSRNEEIIIDEPNTIIDNDLVTVKVTRFFREVYNEGTDNEFVNAGFEIEAENKTEAYSIDLYPRDCSLSDRRVIEFAGYGGSEVGPGKIAALKYVRSNQEDFEDLSALYELEGNLDLGVRDDEHYYTDLSGKLEFSIPDTINNKNKEAKDNSTSDDVQIYKIGETASTDMVEFTLLESKISDTIALTGANSYKPDPAGNLHAGDDDTFIWNMMKIKNLTKGDMNFTDSCEISVDYDNGYTYANGTYATEGMRAGELQIMKALDELTYHGYIEVAGEVKSNRTNPLYLVVKLPSSSGSVEVRYDLSPNEGTDTSQQARDVSDAFAHAIKQIQFIKENSVGEKFADSFIEETRTVFDNIDTDYVNKNLPKTSKELPTIKKNIDKICDLVEDMGETGSTDKVDTIKDLCDETRKTIEELLESELSAFN